MGLPWSAERLLGWRDQFGRMKRWHRRVTTNPATLPAEQLDEVLIFFLFCYSLRDWIIYTGGIDSAKIDGLISSNQAMRICRDICNRTKHHTLSKPSIDAQFSIGREFEQSTAGSPKSTWFIIAGSEKSDLIGLTYQCVAFWEAIVSSGLLTEPNDPFALSGE